MCLNVSLVIVPNWVESAMLTGKLRPAAVLDLHALSSILSRRDVSFYAACNMVLWDKLPLALKQTFNAHELIDRTGKSTLEDDHGNRPSPQEIHAFMESIFPGTWDGALFQVKHPECGDLVSAFPYASDPEQPVDTTSVLFDVFYINENTYGVRFYPRDPKVAYGQQLANCYDKLLEMLSGHFPLEKVAVTAVFQEFVKLSRSIAHVG